MRITLAAYVFVKREEGRSVHVCQPLRGRMVSSRDPLLATALSKLGNKMRKSVNDWIREGRITRFTSWLYDPELSYKVAKLTLILRDRTLRWKLLLVSVPAFGRWIVFSPAVPEVVFEVHSKTDIEDRAIEVYTRYAQKQISEDIDPTLPTHSDMWIEPIEIDVEPIVEKKKSSKNVLASLFGGEKMSGSAELYKVGNCLDDVAANFAPVLGRSTLVDEVDRMLQREDRQGVVLVGPRAVGKTAIIHECVSRRVDRLRKKKGTKPQVWALSPQRLISGMSYLGQWEQRWLAILREATRRDHILYFDDLVGLFTAGRTRDSSLSAADVLRSYLAENSVRILVESTPEQLAVLRRRDRALADQFHLVHVPSWTPDDALPVVLESTYNYEQSASCSFHPESIPLVMRHQEIFSPDQAFPGKAIEMTKTLAKHALSAVSPDSFYQLAGTQVGANMQLMLGLLGDQDSIRNSLSQSLVGQPEAIEALSKVVLRFSQHLQATDRPLGVLLFLGPTGVGKTESAKALTKLLYREDIDESHLVRIDMNELTTPFAAEQLVGTFDQPDGRLTSAVRRRPNCVILLDEIEKAHPDVFDYLLQVIGEGRLTDARGRIADFRSAIIIMTSNLGASEQGSSVGFDRSENRRTQIYRKAAKNFFRPEFFNRIDETVAFRTLGPEDMEQIVRIQMEDVLSRDGLQRRDVFVSVAESAIQRVIQSGFDPQLGARAVRRKIEREVIGPLADCLANLPLDKPALVQVSDNRSAKPTQQAVDASFDRLTCRVTGLDVVKPDPPSRESDLARLIEAGETLHQKLNERLNELRPELAEEDRRREEKIEDASFYALGEQLYRCSDLIKAAKARLARAREPKIRVTASPTMKSKRRDASRSSRLDWQSQEDIRTAIRDAENPRSLSNLTPQQLALGIVDNFSLASCMIEHAMSPRTWLLGCHRVTQSYKPDFSDEKMDSAYARKVELEYASGMDSGDSNSFAARLAKCLEHEWQYDVAPLVLPGGFWLVSGVSIFGLLQPLLGTYRIELRQVPTDFGVLRAIPVPEDLEKAARESEKKSLESKLSAYEKLRELVHRDGIVDSMGNLQTPPEQRVPTTSIRGLLREESAKDFVSGSEVELPIGYWLPIDKIVPRKAVWWTRSLPVPTSLQKLSDED